MIDRPNPAQVASARASSAEVLSNPSQPAPAGRLLRLAGGLLVSFALAGCRHKTLWVPPPSLTAPVDLDVPPEPEHPSLIAELPPPELVPPTPPTLPKKPARRKTAPSRETAQPPPIQVASAADPSALSIGSLSTGGDASSQSQQQVRDLIVSIQKRITALPRSTASQQRSQLRQVTSFLKHAQQALDSGDAEGAFNLATKARLLMDDVEKK